MIAERAPRADPNRRGAGGLEFDLEVPALVRGRLEGRARRNDGDGSVSNRDERERAGEAHAVEGTILVGHDTAQCLRPARVRSSVEPRVGCTGLDVMPSVEFRVDGRAVRPRVEGRIEARVVVSTRDDQDEHEPSRSLHPRSVAAPR